MAGWSVVADTGLISSTGEIPRAMDSMTLSCKVYKMGIRVVVFDGHKSAIRAVAEGHGQVYVCSHATPHDKNRRRQSGI